MLPGTITPILASVSSSLGNGTGVALALALEGPGTMSPSPPGDEGICESLRDGNAGAGVADDLDDGLGDNLGFLDMMEQFDNAFKDDSRFRSDPGGYSV